MRVRPRSESSEKTLAEVYEQTSRSVGQSEVRPPVFKSSNKHGTHLWTHCSRDEAIRGLLVTDHAILNHGQVTWTTPELAPPLLTATPYQREDVSALDRFNVHRCPTRRVFSGTGLELVTRQAMIRYLYHTPINGTVVTHIGAAVAWGPDIIDRADMMVVTLLM
ncbi:uncharacterized protein TNCV_3269961 [Trichonephila clavipes]|uniref:Uncharacterized protein n=1 Tax=Trichonephila clavipes TaxID=2585209 RepID=A0A8X6VF47_TRICX|nr:uncharacterized protein TNCV_3269961 [Trichonephila clavipes]